MTTNIGIRMKRSAAMGAGLTFSATIVLACTATYQTDELSGRGTRSPGRSEPVASQPSPPTETGGSSGTDGAGGRPRCVFSVDDLAPDDAITTLGSLAQTREALQTAIAAAEPAEIRWAPELGGGTTDLSLELLRWDEHAEVDRTSGGCVLLSGEFHLTTTDGLIDANIRGGFTYDGFEAYVPVDVDTCAPVPELCARLENGPVPGLLLNMTSDETSVRSGAERVGTEYIALGTGLSVPRVELLRDPQPEVGPSPSPTPAPTVTPTTAPTVTPATDSVQASPCTDLKPSGQSVLIVFKSGPAPTPGQGGTLVDGMYDLVAATIYQSTPVNEPFLARETIRISKQGTLLEVVADTTGGLIASLKPAGAELNATTVCPLGEGRSFGPRFTATPGRFTLLNGLYIKEYLMRPAAN